MSRPGAWSRPSTSRSAVRWRRTCSAISPARWSAKPESRSTKPRFRRFTPISTDPRFRQPEGPPPVTDTAALSPAVSEFEALWARGENGLVHARLAADLDTPVSLMLKLAGNRRDSFMLESVTGGEVRGRYSVVGLKPDLIWQCRGGESRINRQARFDGEAFE